jgi:pimeloyl-ACP methyl ester carboxylesterase
MARRMTIEVTTASGVLVDHRLIAHDEPAGLLVILPGRGYTCDYPLLHYLRKAAADRGYDVLSVWYSFQIAPQVMRDDPVTLEQLAAEVDQAMREALKRGYDRVCVAGKSLGTPLAALYAAQAERLILLTPIGTSALDVGATPTLAVVGTADPSYQPEQINASGGNVEWLVLAGLDHSLEAAGDWLVSLDSLRQVTQACVDFLS